MLLVELLCMYFFQQVTM